MDRDDYAYALAVSESRRGASDMPAACRRRSIAQISAPVYHTVTCDGCTITIVRLHAGVRQAGLPSEHRSDTIGEALLRSFLTQLVPRILSVW